MCPVGTTAPLFMCGRSVKPVEVDGADGEQRMRLVLIPHVQLPVVSVLLGYWDP